MSRFEYKVVPAPVRGLKGRGIKGTPARFANALQSVMNEYGADGWEYQRTDTLPVEERQGLTGKTTTFQNMLVFRRPRADDAPMPVPVAALLEDHTEEDGAEPEGATDVQPEAQKEDSSTNAEPQQDDAATDQAAEGAEAVTASDEQDTLDPELPKDDTSDDNTATGKDQESAQFAFPWKRHATPARDSE